MAVDLEKLHRIVDVVLKHQPKKTIAGKKPHSVVRKKRATKRLGSSSKKK